MSLENRYACSPNEVKTFDTDQLRSNFLLSNMMVPDQIKGAYSYYERMITLGAVPVKGSLKLPNFHDFTKQENFLDRREIGIINVGGAGSVSVDGENFSMENKDCLYIGLGKKDIIFSSNSESEPAVYYMNSTPAHKEYPTQKAAKADANPVELGAPDTCNERTIFQYIHLNGIKSCQLVMGFTELKTGSVWNTFPPHQHDRRMEVYFYFDLPTDQKVCHLMGQPQETRHIFVKNHEAVISPNWSIHSGAGTSNYSFIWGMGGENMEFTDMDQVIDILR
ncbi:MAG: 5-dehydro-4-deoxy-D-glucuronate isomerase [Cyclobacteriaceae bacterium]|nr:5-dehydro-4-deoxy-D-glucuronate isomerase [Cyclobacteriaceae bacterium]MCK5276913.1 5-dehydro-4-deoxy-D-glucuronate isomerase [Cyclobacteriaceae bacterium]